jgi:hypothetical protein
MNKIERAIRDTKLHLKNLERESLIIEAKMKAYKDQLIMLETIQDDQSIPYSNQK